MVSTLAQLHPGVRACCIVAFLGTVCPASAQWVEAPGSGWMQVSLYHHDTATVFSSEGKTESIFADGHAITTSLFVTATAGLFRGVDAWLQLPVHRLSFNNAAGNRERLGIGDVRVYVRAGPELVGLPPLPVALRAGVKLPGGDFPVDAEIIPLGEGQRDWEVLLEAGHSFYPRSVYLMGWIGYRWRERNDGVDWKPGDERFAFAAAGGRAGFLSWKLAAEGWTSQSPRIQGIRVVSARRAILQIMPSLGVGLGSGTFEVGARVPVAGRNLPAGPSFFAGYFMRLAWF